MTNVNDWMRMICLIEKIDRNQKFAEEIRVSNVSELLHDDKKHENSKNKKVNYRK